MKINNFNTKKKQVSSSKTHEYLLKNIEIIKSFLIYSLK